MHYLTYYVYIYITLLQLLDPQYGNVNDNNASVDDSAWMVEVFSAYL